VRGGEAVRRQLKVARYALSAQVEMLLTGFEVG